MSQPLLCSVTLASLALAALVPVARAESLPPTQVLEAGVGYRWSLPANTPILTLAYRHPVSSWLALRGGLEFGGVESTVGANPANTANPTFNSNPPVPTPIVYTGFSAAFLTTGPLYVGAGATIAQSFYNDTQTSFGPPNQIEYRYALEGIVGARYDVAPWDLAAEYRLGNDLSGTLTFRVGAGF